MFMLLGEAEMPLMRAPISDSPGDTPAAAVAEEEVPEMGEKEFREAENESLTSWATLRILVPTLASEEVEEEGSTGGRRNDCEDLDAACCCCCFDVRENELCLERMDGTGIDTGEAKDPPWYACVEACGACEACGGMMRGTMAILGRA